MEAEKLQEYLKTQRELGANVEGYEYVYETPDRILDPQQVKETIICVRRDFQNLVHGSIRTLEQTYRDNPEISRQITLETYIKQNLPSDNYFRDLLKENKLYALFARPNDHEKTFDIICSKKCTSQDYENLLLLCELRKHVNSGTITEQEARLQLKQMIVPSANTSTIADSSATIADSTSSTSTSSTSSTSTSSVDGTAMSIESNVESVTESTLPEVLPSLESKKSSRRGRGRRKY